VRYQYHVINVAVITLPLPLPRYYVTLATASLPFTLPLPLPRYYVILATATLPFAMNTGHRFLIFLSCAIGLFVGGALQVHVVIVIVISCSSREHSAYGSSFSTIV
jgi:hypothetical protein